MDILDMILGAEMANEYTDSQRLAYVEKKVLTYDGNPDKRIVVDDRSYMVHVSDEHIDLNSIKSGTVTTEDGSTITMEITDENSQIITENGVSVLSVSFSGTTAPAVILVPDEVLGLPTAVKRGTYLLGYTTDILSGYISRIECVETVHQINKKFIPNTVINLCDYGIDSYQILQIAMGTGKLEGRIPADYETLERLFDAVPADGTPLAVMINNGKDPIIMCYNPVVGINPSGASVGSLSTSATLVEENLGKRIDMTILIQNSNAVRSIYYFIEINDKPADVTL